MFTSLTQEMRDSQPVGQHLPARSNGALKRETCIYHSDQTPTAPHSIQLPTSRLDVLQLIVLQSYPSIKKARAQILHQSCGLQED